MARDHSPLDGTTAGDQLAPRREQSHSAKPGSQRLESSGLGAGLHADRPGAGTDPHSTPCVRPHARVLSHTTHVVCACTHTDTHQPKLDTASAHLESGGAETSSLLSPASSIPAGTSGERAGVLERGGQRSEASKAPLASYCSETLRLQDKLPPSCPERRARRWVRAQGAELQIKVLHPLGRQCPFTKLNHWKSHFARKSWSCPQQKAP